MARNDDGAPKRASVIGLGRFGTSVAETLHDLGYEVTAIDIDEKRVAEIADDVTLAAQGDATDEEVLRSLAVDRSDYAIVAQGENLEANVLTTLILKKLRVPWVVAKATSTLHGELLRRIGANQIVFPERDAGLRLAHSLPVRHITDYISLSPATGVAKLTAPAHFVGDSLTELCAEVAGPLEILLIKRQGSLIVRPPMDERVEPNDELLVVGGDAAIDAFASLTDDAQ